MQKIHRFRLLPVSFHRDTLYPTDLPFVTIFFILAEIIWELRSVMSVFRPIRFYIHGEIDFHEVTDSQPFFDDIKILAMEL